MVIQTDFEFVILLISLPVVAEIIACNTRAAKEKDVKESMFVLCECVYVYMCIHTHVLA